MGDLFWNKVFGALLAVALGVMGLQTISESVFAESSGAHHGEETHSLNDWAHSRFAYYTEMTEVSATGEAIEEVYDLGALLAAADPVAGGRSFAAKCSVCHTINDGGLNGTGPNIHGIMTEAHAHRADFTYSGGMQAKASEPWTYAEVDKWLENPGAYIPGTSMAFAGLRRDDERANVIAYLAENSPGAAAFPAPLPAEEETAEAPAEGGEAATVEEAPVESAAAEGETAPAEEGAN